MKVQTLSRGNPAMRIDKTAGYESVVEDSPLTPFLTRLALYTSGGTFLDGYILVIIGIALMQWGAQLKLDAFRKGLIGAAHRTLSQKVPRADAGSADLRLVRRRGRGGIRRLQRLAARAATENRFSKSVPSRLRVSTATLFAVAYFRPPWGKGMGCRR